MAEPSCTPPRSWARLKPMKIEPAIRTMPKISIPIWPGPLLIFSARTLDAGVPAVVGTGAVAAIGLLSRSSLGQRRGSSGCRVREVYMQDLLQRDEYFTAICSCFQGRGFPDTGRFFTEFRDLEC